LLQKEGEIPKREMYNTFNMGVGMCVAVAKEQAQAAVEALKAAGADAFVMGEVVSGGEGVVLC
ncbi:AIR synthase-related protein, partial [Blautia wexlerae]|nr:AIR synthase-related protein [Blautia wexlerae]